MRQKQNYLKVKNFTLRLSFRKVKRVSGIKLSENEKIFITYIESEKFYTKTKFSHRLMLMPVLLLLIFRGQQRNQIV